MKILYLKIIVLFCYSVLLFGCKTKLNQTINKQKEGLWVQKDSVEYIYKIVGRYHKNQEIGTWRYFYNNKLVRKERYRKNVCKTKFYHANGKLQKKGFTKSEFNNGIFHWFYFGNWKFYDSTGVFVKNITYINGKAKDSLNQDYNEFRMGFSKTN